MSPINEWGRTRPELYEVFRELVGIYRQMDPPSLKKLTDIAVTVNPIQYAARTLTHNSPVLTALYDADVDYDLYDPRVGAPRAKVVFYSGNQWLERKAQLNLRRYVEEGGTLIAFRNFPRKDDQFEPCEVVGFHEPSRILFEFKQKFDVQFSPSRPKVTVVSSVFCFDQVQGDAVKASLGPYGRQTVGYRKKIGKGQLIHLGFEPTADLILELLQFLKVPLYTHSTTQEIKTALFSKGEKTYYLVVVNNGREEKSALIKLPCLEGRRRRFLVRDLVTGKKESFSLDKAPHFATSIFPKDGRVFEFRRL